ncbi:hypothetical protein Tco_0531619, partial [Tanacetum coccineum]
MEVLVGFVWDAADDDACLLFPLKYGSQEIKGGNINRGSGWFCFGIADACLRLPLSYVRSLCVVEQ